MLGEYYFIVCECLSFKEDDEEEEGVEKSNSSDVDSSCWVSKFLVLRRQVGELFGVGG